MLFKYITNLYCIIYCICTIYNTYVNCNLYYIIFRSRNKLLRDWNDGDCITSQQLMSPFRRWQTVNTQQHTITHMTHTHYTWYTHYTWHTHYTWQTHTTYNTVLLFPYTANYCTHTHTHAVCCVMCYICHNLSVILCLMLSDIYFV